MNVLSTGDMTDAQLLAGLRGAMEWQRIVQKRGGGPEAARDALAVVHPYAVEHAHRQSRQLCATMGNGTNARKM